jgi:hypothetical protein
MFRSLLLGLQLGEGIDISHFQARFGADPRKVFSKLFQELGEFGCLLQENGSVRLSKYGAYFVEDVCDYIIDAVLAEESGHLARAPHSERRDLRAADEAGKIVTGREYLCRKAAKYAKEDNSGAWEKAVRREE